MLESFLLLARSFIPFKIRCNEDSKLMRFLGFFVKIFNSKWEQYTTTYMNTIYFPRILFDNPYVHQITLFAHETIHLRDRKRLTPPIYGSLYLSPQILVVLSFLSLLAIWFSNWWLLSLLALGFVCPIPSPGRVYLEKRAYLMSMAALLWLYNDIEYVENMVPRYVKQFTGKFYYYMGAWSEDKLARWFRTQLAGIQYGKYPDEFFKAVHDFIVENRDAE